MSLSLLLSQTPPPRYGSLTVAPFLPSHMGPLPQVELRNQKVHPISTRSNFWYSSLCVQKNASEGLSPSQQITARSGHPVQQHGWDLLHALNINPFRGLHRFLLWPREPPHSRGRTLNSSRERQRQQPFADGGRSHTTRHEASTRSSRMIALCHRGVSKLGPM